MVAFCLAQRKPNPLTFPMLAVPSFGPTFNYGPPYVCIALTAAINENEPEYYFFYVTA